MKTHQSAPDVTETDDGFGLLVVGSGPAGVHAAVGYVSARGPGDVCLVSSDTHAPYQRPPLSKDVLSGEAAPEVTPLLDDEDAQDAWSGVDVRLGCTVESIDIGSRLVRTTDGLQLRYSRLVLATGSEPRELPGADVGAPVFALRSLADARRIVHAVAGATTAVVVGSGFIGCEAAASLARRGLRTILVTPESAPQSSRLGDWAAARITEWLTELGVELLTGVEVDGVDPAGVVRLDDGSEVAADLVVAAVGVTQARTVLDESRLELDDGRLVVDEHLRTSDPHVWAAGDVAHARHSVADRHLRVEHWGDAITMGGVAGRNAAASASDSAGQPEGWSEPPGFWSEVGDHTFKYSAWGDGFENAAVVEHGEGAFTIWYTDATGELVGVLTHERDADYERAAELLTRRVDLDEAGG